VSAAVSLCAMCPHPVGDHAADGCCVHVGGFRCKCLQSQTPLGSRSCRSCGHALAYHGGDGCRGVVSHAGGRGVCGCSARPGPVADAPPATTGYKYGGLL
jgi:hypothetical protein